MKNRINGWLRVSGVCLLVVLFGVSCAGLRSGDSQADHPKDRAAIERRLEEIFAAAAGKDFERLESYHAYGPKFTKYSGTSAERLDATGGRKGEHDGLGAIQGLNMRASDLKIDVFGNTGIATFILDYSFESVGGAVHRKDRSTLVFIQERGDWKIVHEHLTPVQP